MKEENMPQEEENLDLDVAVETGVAILFEEQAAQRLLQAAQSNDPVAVAAKAVVAVLVDIRSRMKEEDLALNDEVFVGDDGAAAQLLVHVFNMFQAELGWEASQEDYERAMDLMEEDAAMAVQQEQGLEQAAQPAPPVNPQGVASSLAMGGMQ